MDPVARYIRQRVNDPDFARQLDEELTSNPAGVRRVTLSGILDRNLHHIQHDADGLVLVQVYAADGTGLAFPGVGPAIKQTPGCVTIARVHEDYYPLTVVMIG